ncbi:Uu.00g138000.m01.CDS01 [Anthostomella pinea]|uniref:Uu.00g138000.m01.CDS01 n=1 Tax=Anthostomella pinea TaxID=933095 RepID=A0AAI8VQE5_9PEZI|nr:Uu.00g138000.m01.CDS01 [Anthostomella pinea]
MQILPFVQVKDLPPSASFYSAVTQPLGLCYISADSSSIVFGDTSASPPKPVFEVRSTGAEAGSDLRPARLVLSAASPSIVTAFQQAAVRANPDLLIGGQGDPGFLRPHGDPSSHSSSESRGKITDLEGNIMEVAYVVPRNYPPNYGGSTVRKTQSTTKEVSHILDWNLDVATSVVSRSAAGSVAPSRAPPRAVATRRPDEEPPYVLRRSVTTSTLETSPSHTAANVFSTGAVIGSVLGAVAAGAAVGGAITYAIMRGDRERAPRQEYDVPPTFQRRSTFPDPYPDQRPRYVEVERTVEKIHYPEKYPPSSRKYPPPTYVARYSQAGSQVGGARSRTMDDYDNRASRHSSHHTSGTRTRRSSEAGSTRRPLMITEAEHRSSAGSSKHSASPRLLMDVEHRSAAGSKHSAAASKTVYPVDDSRSRVTARYIPAAAVPLNEFRSHAGSRHVAHRLPEVETYVSARSQRSASTVRPAPRLVAAESMPVRSKAGTRYSSATVKPAGPSRAASYASARHVPLPPSKADWADDDDDDLVSLAPSDSISCVGSKHSRRSRH